ncbi:hypothetical protein HUB94_19645 (plasmid) [Paenibacillus cellulosilyticus]|nr:hypothetical protein HUB94_19645 [Paenibacillus cellulosilyticus]
MLFSIIEGVAIFSFMLYTFRFDLKKYIVPALMVNTLMSLQSYFIREDSSMVFLVVVINFLILVFFMATIVRIPLIWAMFTSFIGYALFIALQTGLLLLSFGRITVHMVQTIPIYGYIIQLLTGVFGFIIMNALYRLGIGFTFDFEKFRFRKEAIVVASLILAAGIPLGVLLYIGDLYINMTFLVICLSIFFYYSLRKENEENASLFIE